MPGRGNASRPRAPFRPRRASNDPVKQLLARQQSAQVLETFLDRVHPDWRERVRAAGAGEGGRGPADEGTMSRDEAYQVLGLEPGVDEEAIKAAYHRLIAGLHPDHGGSTYLAAKINQAKDVLLGNK